MELPKEKNPIPFFWNSFSYTETKLVILFLSQMIIISHIKLFFKIQ